MPEPVLDSILDTTKHALGLDPEYTVFDQDIIMHINSVFATLQQLGVGPAVGFEIADSSTVWVAYTEGNLALNSVRTLMYYRVRLAFDPPATSFGIEAFEKKAQEYEWRLLIVKDPPSPYPDLPEEPEDD